MELKICHLYPDVMNLSADRGNVICMEKRLQWRGIGVSVSGVGIGQPLDASAYDLIFLGDGQPFTQQLLLQDLAEKKQQLHCAAEDGVPMLAICGGYQLFCRTYESADGTVTEALGLLDAETKAAQTRLVGNYKFTVDELGIEAVGFENHSGRTVLGPGVKPLGRCVSGHGNNGEDGTEGARYKNIFASYAHGSLLPKNPVLCDHILKIALERKYGTVELEPLDDAYAERALRYMLGRLSEK